MSKKRKKKKKGVGTVVLLSLLIIVCVICLRTLVRGAFADGIKSAVAGKVTETVMEQAIQAALESSGDPEAAARAKEIVADMDEADKKEAEAIVEKYANEETVSAIKDMMESGINSESVSQVVDYLQDNVSEEDIGKLQELYEKYGAEVP